MACRSSWADLSHRRACFVNAVKSHRMLLHTSAAPLRKAARTAMVMTPAPLATYERLVSLAARSDWEASLQVLTHALPAAAISIEKEEDSAISAATAASSSLAEIGVSVEGLMSLLLFYGQREGAYAVWGVIERAASSSSAPETGDDTLLRACQTRSAARFGGRDLILQLAAYALLVDDAPERAGDILLLETWLPCEASTPPQAPHALMQVIEAYLRLRLVRATPTPSAHAHTDAVRAWQSALHAATQSTPAGEENRTWCAVLDTLTSLSTHFLPTATTSATPDAVKGIEAYRALVRAVFVPLGVVAPWHPFTTWSPSAPVQTVSDSSTHREKVGPDEQTLARLQLQCSIATGDWQTALHTIQDAFSEPPLRALRLALRACEGVDKDVEMPSTAGAAWQGALHAWHCYSGQCGGATGALTCKEAGRLLTMLAHARKGLEAQRVFDRLPASLVDEYNVVQTLIAVGASRESCRRGDALLRVWGSWRSKVGDTVAPTPRMLAVFLHNAARGSAVEARAAVNLVKAASQQLLATDQSGGCNAVKGPSDVTPSPPPSQFSSSSSAATAPLALNFETSEADVAMLLRDRWDGSWQEALRVAVASGRPALFGVVARASPLHHAVYEAGVQAMQCSAVALSADQRAALMHHVHAAKHLANAVVVSSSDGAADARHSEDAQSMSSAPSAVGTPHSPWRGVATHRQNVDWAVTLLDQLLGKEKDERSRNDRFRGH